MQNHIQIRGNLLEYCYTDSFIEKPMLPPDLIVGRIVSPAKFIETQKHVKTQFKDKMGSKIEIRDMDELKYSTCIMFGEGEGFVAVTPTGEIVSLLKNPGSKMKNFMGLAFANAIMVGGNRLDCYNCDNLGPSYCRRGFIPICRIDFNPEYAREMAELYKGECKEIVFFLFCGDPVYSYWEKMQDGMYIALEKYEFIPHITQIQQILGKEIDGSDYSFAGQFRDMVWGKWNGGLKNKYMFKPNKLMEYICSDKERLAGWMGERLS